MHVSLFVYMCLFTHRTRPQQMSSNPGTALRQWQPSHHPAPADKNQIEWSCTVKPGTLPPQTLLTRQRETSRLKCEETHTHKKDTRINGRRFTKWRIYKRIIHLFTRIDHYKNWKKKKLKKTSIFSRGRIQRTKLGLGEYMGEFLTNCFWNVLILLWKGFSFTHLEIWRKKNISAPSFL